MFLPLMVIGVFLFTGRAGAGSGSKILVAVSIAPQAFFVKQIGGDRVQVVVLLPPGANPATFEPRARTLLALSKVRLYFRIHVPFEDAWMEKFRAVNRRMKVIDTTKGIRRVKGDPHIWLAPRLVKHQVRSICEALEKIDPRARDKYEKNGIKFRERLEALDKTIRRRFRGAKRRVFLVYHPCWGYFAREFGLTQVAIEREGKPPGAAFLSGILQMARRKGIHCIFAQPQFDTRSARMLAHLIHGRVVLLDPLAKNWGENLQASAEKIARCLNE